MWTEEGRYEGKLDVLPASIWSNVFLSASLALE